jgi:hypothetical protein
MSILCKGCGPNHGGFYNPCEDDYCVNCIETFEERSRLKREWREYHDEPCPEIELPQFRVVKP